MRYFLCIIIGYFLGSINPAYFFGKIKGIDIREQGSHNAGASNTVILFGWKLGTIVALIDFGKAALAYYICGLIFPNLQYANLIAGVATIYGHVYPFYLKFRGGKGTATYVGLMLISNFKYALLILILMALITIITKFIVFGTFTIISIFPITLYISLGVVPCLIILTGSLVILYKHRINIIRLKNHTEIPLTFNK